MGNELELKHQHTTQNMMEMREKDMRLDCCRREIVLLKNKITFE
jgi:hypothetical protein